MDEGDTLVNAILGGVVTFVTGNFVPFAPILGGAIAGYLQGGTRREGMRAGAYSGLIAYIPWVLVGVIVWSLIGVISLGFGLGAFGPGGVGPGAAGLLGMVFLLFLFVMSLVYFVGGGAVGGWLGNYVKYETDVDL